MPLSQEKKKGLCSQVDDSFALQSAQPLTLRAFVDGKGVVHVPAKWRERHNPTLSGIVVVHFRRNKEIATASTG